MAIVAAISDTHLPRGARRLPEDCLERLRAADAILHCGDFLSCPFSPDPPGETIGPFPVKVKKVIPNELIVLEWEGAPGRDTRVEMNHPLSELDAPWEERQADLVR